MRTFVILLVAVLIGFIVGGPVLLGLIGLLGLLIELHCDGLIYLAAAVAILALSAGGRP